MIDCDANIPAYDKGTVTALPTNIRLGWKWQIVTDTHTLAYYTAELSPKMFYSTGPFCDADFKGGLPPCLQILDYG